MNYAWMQRIGIASSIGLAGACGPNVESESAGTENDSEGVATTNADTDPGTPDPRPPSTPSNPSTTTPSTTGQTTVGSDTFPGSGSDTATAGPVGLEFDGTYLFAVAASINPATPFQFVAEVTAANGTISLDMQPLSLDVGSTTTPREPIGDSFLIDSIPLVDGEFGFELLNYTVVGGANPITGGTLVVDLVLRGSVDPEQYLCGTADGEVLEPASIPLNGSEFGAVQIEDPLVLPPPRVDCAP